MQTFRDDNILHPVILNFTTDYNKSSRALVDIHTETLCMENYLFGNYFHCVPEIIRQTEVRKLLIAHKCVLPECVIFVSCLSVILT